MKIGRVFLAGQSSFPEEGQRFIHSIPDVICQENADRTTPFMLYEAPIRSLQVPVFILQPLDGESGFYSTVLDISGQVLENQGEVKERGVYINESLVLDPAPWEWQKLIENSVRYWEPFLRPGAPFHQLREVGSGYLAVAFCWMARL